jgi:UDPglucose--hexose-1-phosphate uridylyltransferase
VSDEVRRDELTGAAVIVAPGRQTRPVQPGGDGRCPFCVGGLEAPEPYETRWFVNRWPTFPDGRSEVHLFSPDHDATLASVGAEGVRRVVELWAERTAALGARDDVGYVLLFENSGAEVGATIGHPHGQAFAYASIPDAPARELASGRCALCHPVADTLVVTASGGWQAWVPSAPTMPYELRLAPAAHVPDLPSLDHAGRGELAAVLADALARLDRHFGAPVPRMLWVHQRPTDGGAWPTAHLHLHVLPLWREPGVARFVAGGELGGGIHVVPVDPLHAAAALRSC